RSLQHAAWASALLLAALGTRALQGQAYSYAPGPQYQQPYSPQQYAQQPQYAPQPQYAAQPQYQPQYDQQPYAEPGPVDPKQGYGPSQQAAQPFVAQQLEQLVAPIALYPDTLVAQILAASTYPAQVIAADNWLHS